MDQGGDIDPWANLGEPRKLEEPEAIETNGETKQEQPTFDAKSIQFEGWVEKQSRYIKSWRHRWLVLQHPFLYTFKSRRIYENPTEIVNLAGGHVVSNPFWTDPHGPHGFDVVTKELTFSFRTPMRHIAASWALNIRLAMRGQPVMQMGVDPQSMALNSANRGGSRSPRDIEDAMVQHVLRQSALEAGVPYNGQDAKTQQMAAETALRIQQDAEYRRSLEEDMRREAETQGTSEPFEEAKAETKSSTPPPSDSKNLTQRSTTSENTLPAVSQVPPEPAMGPSTCTCQVRLPSGKRLVRRFNVSDTIKIVRLYVRQMGELEDDAFDLVSNFPRKVWGDPDLTLQGTG